MKSAAYGTLEGFELLNFRENSTVFKGTSLVSEGSGGLNFRENSARSGAALTCKATVIEDYGTM